MPINIADLLLMNTMANIRKTLLVPPTLRGQWFRVVKRTDSELLLSPHGIETPNAECVYIQKDSVCLTEDQIRHNQKCYEELKRHIDLEVPISEYNEYQVAGYLIDTEESQGILYHWDANTSNPNILPYVMLKI